MDLLEMGGSLGPHSSSLGSLLSSWNLTQEAVLLRSLLQHHCPLPREMAKHSCITPMLLMLYKLKSISISKRQINSNWKDQTRLSGKGKI